MKNDSKYYREQFKSLMQRYNAQNKGIQFEVVDKHALVWNTYNPDHQTKLINDRRTEINAGYKNQAVDLKNKVLEDRKNIYKGITKIKFPLSLSSDASSKVAGELQINSALLFLSTSHSIQDILSTVKLAIENNRPEFFFTITDSILRSNYTKNQIKDLTAEQFHENIEAVNKSVSALTKGTQQKYFIDSLKELLNSFPDKAKLDELQTELNNFVPVETMANDALAQIEQGRESILLPELWNDLNETEKMEIEILLSKRGNITEIINFKRRAQEAISIEQI